MSGDSDRPALDFLDLEAEFAECHFCGLTWAPDDVDGFDLQARTVPVCPEHVEGCR